MTKISSTFIFFFERASHFIDHTTSLESSARISSGITSKENYKPRVLKNELNGGLRCLKEQEQKPPARDLISTEPARDQS
jgi:hypothetical protein